MHVPVMAPRCLALLDPALQAPGALLVDATLGLGGHTEIFLSAIPGLRVIGLDRDPEALARAAQRLERFGQRLDCVHAVYDELPDVLAERGIAAVQGVLADLGVSSMQLDQVERGFSYSVDAPLDMRMDPTAGLTAAQVLNTYDILALAQVLSRYGEEKFGRRIAEFVVRERQIAPFTNSARLVELLYAAIPAATRRTGGHPAKRTFQALRIEVNAELTALATFMPAALNALAPAGRIVVMAYQSLEDKLVKQAFVAATTANVPRDLPVIPPAWQPKFRLLTRGAEQATAGEIDQNPRSASVRLRAVERLATVS